MVEILLRHSGPILSSVVHHSGCECVVMSADHLPRPGDHLHIYHHLVRVKAQLQLHPDDCNSSNTEG